MPEHSDITGIPEMIGDVKLRVPRRRGRPRFADEPTATTTVRVTVADWNWVKSHPGLEFSALLRAKIHQLKIEETNPPVPRTEFVKAARKLGWNDQRIADALRDTPP